MIAHAESFGWAALEQRRTRRPQTGVPARAGESVRAHERTANVAPSPWPDEHYVDALRGSRWVRFVGEGFRAPPLDREKAEDRALHDAIVRDERERRELREARSTAAGPDLEYIERRIRFVDDRVDRLVDQLYGLSREAVAIMKRALGEHVQNDPLPARDVAEMTSDALWERLDAPARDEAWADALAELAEREDPGLSSYIVAELQKGEISADVRNALIFAAECSQCYDPHIRASLKSELLAKALLLRDAHEERPLWAAIRGFASLVPVEEADGLLSFLRDEDPPMTQIVALQGVEKIFSGRGGHGMLSRLHPVRACAPHRRKFPRFRRWGGGRERRCRPGILRRCDPDRSRPAGTGRAACGARPLVPHRALHQAAPVPRSAVGAYRERGGRRASAGRTGR